MIVRSFLKWFENAPADERAEAAQGMARAYLDDHLGSDSRIDAEAALTLILDDPSIAVRRALAWELAGSEGAPRHIIVSLAHDVSDVSAMVLARSPILRDPDLIDCAGVGDALTHMGIALRPYLSAEVTAALVEVADAEPMLALLRNPGVEIAPHSFARMLERKGDTPALREALGARDDLPSPVRQALLATLSDDLMKFVGQTGWMSKGRAERMIHETKEAATVSLSSHAPDLGPLVDYLRSTAQLTPALLLRSLLCGETALFGASLVSLTGFQPQRIATIIEGRGHGALAALYQKAGLPGGLYPAFAATLSAIRDLGVQPASGEPELRRPIIQRALAACLEQDETEMRPLLAMLRRFDAEAARKDARALTNAMMAQPAPLTLESRAPVDMLMLEQALDVDLTGQINYDAPFHADELTDVPPVAIDLDQFASDLILDDDDLFDGLVVEPEDRIAVDAALSGDKALVRSEIQKLIATAFDAVPETKDKDLVALEVVESPSQMRDEAYFATWEIRKQAA